MGIKGLFRKRPIAVPTPQPWTAAGAVFDHFKRGIPGTEKGRGVDEKFQDPRAVLQSENLRFYDDNREGKIFLGLADATITIEEKRLRDGRLDRYAVGGSKIGVGDDRHIVTIAGSRAGKGRAVLVPNLITYPGSVLVVDPKGDLAKLTADRRRALGQDVYVLDPFEAAGPRFRPGSQFNPMAMLEGSSNLLADAGLIADALVVPVPGNKDTHWDDSARNLVEGLVLHVATSGEFIGRRNLVTVYKQLWKVLEIVPAAPATPDLKPQPKAFTLEVAMRDNPEEAVQHAASDFYERADKERESVLSTARRHLHFLGYPAIQKTLEDSSFDLRDLKRKNVSIFLSLPAMRMGSCSRWLRLFVNLTLSAMEWEKGLPASGHSVLLILDEFAVLGPMKQVEDAAGQIAGLGCKLWPVLQDLGQLKALYSERWETFLGNSGVLQFFGNSELTTLEWIAKRLGTTSVLTESQSNIAYQASATGATGKSWSSGTAELMSASEIARFFGRDDDQLRQLIIRPSVSPIVLHRAFYDRHEFFHGKYTPPEVGQ